MSSHDTAAGDGGGAGVGVPSQQLPVAIAFLAMSIFTLAAVLFGIERGNRMEKRRRCSPVQHRGQADESGTSSEVSLRGVATVSSSTGTNPCSDRNATLDSAAGSAAAPVAAADGEDIGGGGGGAIQGVGAASSAHVVIISPPPSLTVARQHLLQTDGTVAVVGLNAAGSTEDRNVGVSGGGGHNIVDPQSSSSDETGPAEAAVARPGKPPLQRIGVDTSRNSNDSAAGGDADDANRTIWSASADCGADCGGQSSATQSRRQTHKPVVTNGVLTSPNAATHTTPIAIAPAAAVGGGPAQGGRVIDSRPFLTTATGNVSIADRLTLASADSAAGRGRGGRRSTDSDRRRSELLVHNVSHKDMVLSLRRTRHAAVTTAGSGRQTAVGSQKGTGLDAPDTAVGRPKFSLFKASSELILEKLLEIRADGRGDPPPAVCTVYRRGEMAAYTSGSSSHADRFRSDEDSDDCGDEDEDRDGEGGGSEVARADWLDDSDAGNSSDSTGCEDSGNAAGNTTGNGLAATRQQQRRPPRRRRLREVGFDLDANPVPISDLAGYRVRSGDLDRLIPPCLSCPCSPDHMRLKRHDSLGLPIIMDRGRMNSTRGRSATAAAAAAVRQQLTGNDDHKLGDLDEGAVSTGWGERGEGALCAPDSGEEAEAFITGVYFPLLSVLMPKWLEQLATSGDDDAAKTVLLVSGVGQPRNRRHRVEDNSTEITAVLMEAFLNRHYPDIRVVLVHSNTNIFRYDDNIRFVKTELLPLLNAERSQMAEKYGGDWQDNMHITLSFADGSPARISSINSALRHFRPSFIHIWELKTLWHEKQICEDDVEVHTFEDIDMLPPVPADEVDELTALVIAEMLRLKCDLERVLSAPPRGSVVGGDARDDLASFWLRKTKRPVLAVLLVQKAGGKPQLYRGTNMEVSMPTGSLCAERNVIGSALAADLALLRRDIKAVAVLAMANLNGQKATTVASHSPAAAAAAAAAARSTAPLSTPSSTLTTPRPAPSDRATAKEQPGETPPGGSSDGNNTNHSRPWNMTTTATTPTVNCADNGRGYALGDGFSGGRLSASSAASAVGSSVDSSSRPSLQSAPACKDSHMRKGVSVAGKTAGPEKAEQPHLDEGGCYSSPSGSCGCGGWSWTGRREDRGSRAEAGGAPASAPAGRVQMEGSETETEDESRSEEGRQALLAVASVFTKNPGKDPEGERPHSCSAASCCSHNVGVGGEVGSGGSGGGHGSCPNGNVGQCRAQATAEATQAEEGGAAAAAAGRNFVGAAGSASTAGSDGVVVGDDRCGGPSATSSPALRPQERFRSESCADELLAAEDKRAHAKLMAGAAHLARAAVTRSRSFDGGAANSKRRDSAELESWKKVVRRTKLVRSIAATRGDSFDGASAAATTDASPARSKAGRDSFSSCGGAGRVLGGGRAAGSGRVVARVPADLNCINPLKPCGACMEWLKKIAEVNPDFKVITFTDSACEGVFIEDVAQIV